MPSADDYPSTVLEVLDDGARFRPSALRAVKQFAKSYPWRGILAERIEKFRKLNRELSVAYGIPEPALQFGVIDGSSSGASHYIPSQNRIVIVGKLSVVTFLHEYAHCRGMSERAACRWSINLFRRVFPRQYARLVGRGHMLIKPTSISRETGNVSTEGK